MCLFVIVCLYLHIWESMSAFVLVYGMSAWMVSVYVSVCGCRCMPDSVCVLMLVWVCVFL